MSEATRYNWYWQGKCPTVYPKGQLPLPPSRAGDGYSTMEVEGAEKATERLAGVFKVGDRVRVVNLDMTPSTRTVPETVSIGTELTIREIDSSDPLTNILMSNGYWFSASNIAHADLEPLAEGQRFRVGDRVVFGRDIDAKMVKGLSGTVIGFYNRMNSNPSAEFTDPCSIPYFVQPDDTSVFDETMNFTAGHSFNCFAVSERDIEPLTPTPTPNPAPARATNKPGVFAVGDEVRIVNLSAHITPGTRSFFSGAVQIGSEGVIQSIGVGDHGTRYDIRFPAINGLGQYGYAEHIEHV